MNSPSLSLFQAYGIELEYMIVDSESLDIKPLSDKILKEVSGEIQSEVEFDSQVSWSNELVLHVIEIKTNGPKPKIENLNNDFQKSIKKINEILLEYSACLLPTGMHPWMNPFKEAKLWPHDYNEVYEKFDEIFDCSGHGWSNLQSTHLNLPFANDSEFKQLHEAIRLLLPILPAITASSPIVEGKLSGLLDYRLEVYRKNCLRVPIISGEIIPESVNSEYEYKQKILNRIYKEISPYDPDKILQHEWVNARGAIARFERHAIEIRTMDIQECPLADLSICFSVSEILKGIISSLKASDCQFQHESSFLKALLLDVIKDGEKHIVHPHYAGYCEILGSQYRRGLSVKELWHDLLEKHVFPKLSSTDPFRKSMNTIVEQGPLARRILNNLSSSPSQKEIYSVYSNIRTCLQEGILYEC